MSETSGSSILCHLGTETAIGVDKNLSGRDEQAGTHITLHKIEVKQGSKGILASHFQGAQSSAKETPGRVVLREYIVYFG